MSLRTVPLLGRPLPVPLAVQVVGCWCQCKVRPRYYHSSHQSVPTRCRPWSTLPVRSTFTQLRQAGGWGHSNRNELRCRGGRRDAITAGAEIIESQAGLHCVRSPLLAVVNGYDCFLLPLTVYVSH